MANRYNYFYFEAEFKKYLSAGNASASTIKNYMSDLHYFFSWLQNTDGRSELDFSELSVVFTHSLIRTYSKTLTTSTNSANTTTRRLATLRKFFTFCIEQRWLVSNPAVDFNRSTKLDERQELLSLYRTALINKNSSSADLERQINIIKSLIIHS